MVDYENFVKLLKEGLIVTHDITRYNRIMTDYLSSLGIENSIEVIDKLVFFLKVYNCNKESIEVSNHQAYSLGYFPSNYKITLINGMSNNFKLLKNIKFSDNISSIEIRYESKYTDGLYRNDIICPDKLYHLTHTDNWVSIQKKGIYPKSKKRLSNHPERIYLFENINDYIYLLKNLKISDLTDKKYDLIEIDSSDDKFILHTDPNYRIGYFTYDNISSILIKRIYTNL